MPPWYALPGYPPPYKAKKNVRVIDRPSISSTVEKSNITCKQMHFALLQVYIDRCVIVWYYVQDCCGSTSISPGFIGVAQWNQYQWYPGAQWNPYKARRNCASNWRRASISSARARISMDRFGSIHLRIKNSRSLPSWAAEIKFDKIFSGQKYLHIKWP